jgi:hypothetical protein
MVTRGSLGSFGGVVVLALAANACSSPVDEVNDAPTLTFVVQNDSGVDLSTMSDWIEIDDGAAGWLWHSTVGNYGGSPCDEDIEGHGGLPPPSPDLAAGERVPVRWKENAFTGIGGDPGVVFESEGCLTIERVPTGSHTFTLCARQSGVECVVPGEFPRGPQPACVTLTVVLTDDDMSQGVVFRPEALPAQNCTVGTERHR